MTRLSQSSWLFSLLLISGSGLAADQIGQRYFEQLHQELLLRPVEQMLIKLDQLDQSLATLGSNPEPPRAVFSDLVVIWKSVETLYLAGVLDEELIDLPQLIDHFHYGHETINPRLAKILKSQKNLKKALFQSSSKGFNALEFLLFRADATNPRTQQAARISTLHIRKNVVDILKFYQRDEEFVSQTPKALQMVINALLDSSYRLVNWRIGEPAGLIGKGQGKASKQALEYNQSGLSVPAIVAILNTHARVFELGVASGFFSPAGLDQGGSEIKFVRQRISEAQAAAEVVLQMSHLNLDSTEFELLFRHSEALHKAYYFLLVDALGVEARIVDADGD